MQSGTRHTVKTSVPPLSQTIMPSILKRQRSTSGESRIQRRKRSTSNDSHLRALDSFDFDSKDLTETIRNEIDLWYAPSDAPIGSTRIKSSEWVQDIISGGMPKLVGASRVTSSDTGGMPKRVGTSRVTSSDWVGDIVAEGTKLEDGPQCSSIDGFGPLGATPGISDEEPLGVDPLDPLDPDTIDALQSLEETKPKYTEEDVLFGRGGLSNHHIGNKRYRTEANKLKPEYRDQNTTKRQKTVIRNKLVDIVHGYGGRFLVENKSNNTWEEVPLKQARRKASQALREDFR